jgi:ABC-type branched-subunit amino acid transport system ATPase component
MLRDITIKNYRAFKDFSMDGLARVNLIVGSNNAGKTSFLEAIHLLANRGGVAALVERLNARGEFTLNLARETMQGSIHYQVATLYFDHYPSRGSRISLVSERDDWQSLELNYREHAEAQTSGPPLELVATYRSEQPNERGDRVNANTLPLHEGWEYVSDKFVTPLGTTASRSRFVDVAPVDFEYLADLWDSVIRDPKKEQTLLTALRIIAPNAEDVRFTSKRTAGGTLVKLQEYPTRVTISSLGEGVQRVLILALSAVTTGGGILLVDEIDTGLHYRAQADVWRLLIEVAKERDIQIFATTHSWDCVEAFQEALAEDDNAEQGFLFRLQRRGDRIYPVGYTSEDLDVAVRQAIEVR